MNEDLVIKLNEELKRLEDETLPMVEHQWKKRSIYKVPARVTDQNKEAFQPQVVSFGPYHHGEKHLMPMEEQKLRALFHFLKRTKMPLQIIVNNLTTVVQDLKDSYDVLGDDWQDTERFLRVMVLDGCFMLEVLYYYYHYENRVSGNYAPSDPIFSAHGMVHVMHYIRRDMLLLENQLPMLVLIELAAAMDSRYTKKGDAQMFVNILICMFTKSMLLDLRESLHVLDTFTRNKLWSQDRLQEKREHTMHLYDDNQIIVSAMELQEAGIRFKRGKSGVQFKTSFYDTVLHLPFLLVDDTTESIFLNLIAFERLHVGSGHEVTSYVYFMNVIINSVEDVILLQSRGIIYNALESNQAVVHLFNSLAKNIMFDPNSRLGLVLIEINAYHTKRWVKYRAKSVHAYHVSTQWNPLAHISIIFAVLIFTLSLIQTVYTISPYYRLNK